MGDYSRVAHNPSGDVYSTPEKDPSSIRGAILRAETEIDVGINRILGLIQAFGSAEGYYHDDFRRDSALALEMAEKIDGKVAELESYLQLPSSSSDEPFYDTHCYQLSTFKKDIYEIKNTLNNIRRRAALLDGAPRTRTSTPSDLTSYHISEGQKLTYTNRLADDILDQAYSTRYSLGEQRESLFSVKKRMSRILSRAPAISSLLREVWKHKNKQKVVLSLIFGICFIILAYRLFG